MSRATMKNTTGEPYGYWTSYGYKGLTSIGWIYFANESDYEEYLKEEKKHV